MQIWPAMEHFKSKSTQTNSPTMYQSYLVFFYIVLYCSMESDADLSKEHVTASSIDVVVAGVAGVDHEAVDELHGLGTLTAQFAGHHDLASLSPGLHDEAKHTIACPASAVVGISDHVGLAAECTFNSMYTVDELL